MEPINKNNDSFDGLITEDNGKSHSGSDHSSSHHHHHTHSKNRRFRHKFKKIKSFVKKRKYLILNIVIFLTFAILIITLSNKVADKKYATDAYVAEEQLNIEMQTKNIGISVPVFTNPVRLIPDGAKSFVDADNLQDRINIVKANSKFKLDSGLGVKISYSVDSVPKGISVRSSEIRISEDGDFSDTNPDVKKYILGYAENQIEVYYLKTGTHYYYQVTLNLSNDSHVSAIGEFTTEATPRLLTIDGVSNVRDIGGLKTLDGRKIKQGMIIRGREIDGANESGFTISYNGANTLIKQLGIKFDMDLRSPDVAEQISPLNVEHQIFDARQYSEIFTDSGKEATRRIFQTLADETKYPMYMHCTYGIDRTGTICYLLEGLLGAYKEDTLTEYYLSEMIYTELTGEDLKLMINKLETDYDGINMQEKITSYLLSIGVTMEEINSIKDIMLTEAE